MASDWYKTAVFYECYLRAFCDGNGDGHGDFQGLLSKVDYFEELGIDCVWLCPFYPSPLVDDGYDISDYCNIDPKYGTLDELKACIDALHSRGIRVIADLVPNHTSDQHRWFIESRSSRDNPKRDWYVWSDTDQKYADARVIFIDTLDSNWTFDEHTGQYYWHRFYSQQPDLNFDNPEVQAEMLKIVDFWMALGLDGFRVDAVPYLFEREGTNCENLPETHAFLKKMRAHIEQNWGDRIMLCEANQYPEQVRDYFGDGDEFHMGFHFPLMPRLYMALKQHNRASIMDILQRTPAIPDNCQWGIFLRNHDELTLEMVSEEERQFMWQEYAPDPRMRLNLGIRRRLAPLLEGDPRRFALLNALLFTLPGAPVLYYGDEIAMGDNIRLHDRNGVRTPMQWTGERGAGFSRADPDTFYAPLNSDGRYGYQILNVEAQQADPHSAWRQIQYMIALRREHPALTRGSFRFAWQPNEALLAFRRELGDEKILVVANLSDQPQSAEFEIAGTLHDLLTDEPPPAGQGIGLAPYACAWLKITDW